MGIRKNSGTKNYKKSGLLYGILASACITAAILFYCKTDSMGMGTLWLILGSFNVFMAFKVLKESRKDADNDDKNSD